MSAPLDRWHTSGAIDYGSAQSAAEAFCSFKNDLGNLARAFLSIYAEEVPARQQLSRRQYEILSFIETFIETHGYAPSFEEIALNFTFASLSTVHEHLSNLQRKGWIERDYNTSRSITIRRRSAKALA